jgi:hypothetical protein
MLNLFGDEGKNALPEFTAANFNFTSSTGSEAPEPAGFIMIASGLILVACSRAASRRRAHS